MFDLQRLLKPTLRSSTQAMLRELMTNISSSMMCIANRRLELDKCLLMEEFALFYSILAEAHISKCIKNSPRPKSCVSERIPKQVLGRVPHRFCVHWAKLFLTHAVTLFEDGGRETEVSLKPVSKTEISVFHTRQCF